MTVGAIVFGDFISDALTETRAFVCSHEADDTCFFRYSTIEDPKRDLIIDFTIVKSLGAA